jgi:hypothetical protein
MLKQTLTPMTFDTDYKAEGLEVQARFEAEKAEKELKSRQKREEARK